MARQTNKDYAIALYQITQNLKGAELNQVLQNFVGILFRAQKLKQAPAIIAEFEKYAKKQAGIVHIAITSANTLDDNTIAAVKATFGKNVEATTAIDTSLIGGVVVQEENKIFDASLKMQLKKLKLSLQ